MTERTKAHRRSRRFRSTELLICEKCGHEFSILPSKKKKIICPKCKGISNKSGFVPLTAKRTLWVSQDMLAQYYQEVVFKEVRGKFYDIVNLYRESFIHNVNMRAMKTLGFFAYGIRASIKSAYSVDISLEDTAQMIKQHMDPSPVFHQLDSARIELRAGRGRPPKPEKLILLIDAILLSIYPNGYLHFLQDSLTLRYKEYEVSPTYARAHKDRWEKFRKAAKATEVYCRRIWKNLLGIEPPPVPEDWYLDVAREQGLMGGENKALRYKLRYRPVI
jgi:hypothetical protein